MASDESLPTLKILLIGPSGAGKSACTFREGSSLRFGPSRNAYNPPTVLIRYCDDLFDSESSTATIGVDFKVSKPSPPFSRELHEEEKKRKKKELPSLTNFSSLSAFQLKKMSVRGTPYRLNLLDTAGQERFRTLSNSYYRGAHGVILVYDTSNRESFLAMDLWFREAEANAMPGVVTYLVGSKLDKTASRSVKYEEGEALAKRHGSSFCEVSAKTRENVRRPFIELVNKIVSSPQLMNTPRAGGETIAIGGGGGGGAGGLGAPCSC